MKRSFTYRGFKIRPYLFLTRYRFAVILLIRDDSEEYWDETETFSTTEEAIRSARTMIDRYLRTGRNERHIRGPLSGRRR